MPWVFRAYSRVRIHFVGTLPKPPLVVIFCGCFWQCGLVPNHPFVILYEIVFELLLVKPLKRLGEGATRDGFGHLSLRCVASSSPVVPEDWS